VSETRGARLARGGIVVLSGIALLVSGVLGASMKKESALLLLVGAVAMVLLGIRIMRRPPRTESAPLEGLSWKRTEGPAPALPRAWPPIEGEQPWTTGEAVGVALRALRQRPGPTVLVTAFAATVIAVLGVAAFFVVRSQVLPTAIVTAVAGALGVALLSGVMGALYEAALASVRREPLARGIVGRSLRRTPRMLFLLVLLIVLSLLPPFALLAAPFVFAPFFVVDEDASLMTSLRKSWRTSKRSLGTTWLYLLAIGPLVVLGWISGVFAVVTVPLQVLGLGFAYARATGRNELPWFPPEFSSRSVRTFLKVTFAALGLLFAGLVMWVKSLPTIRGSAWSIQDTAIRASAILTGVAVTIVVLALLLPYVLDRLEGRRFTSFVAARHVRSQKSGFLTVISVLSICGVAISSCALSSVVSVMGGFSQDLKRKILGNNAHIVVDTTEGSPFEDYESTVLRVRAVPGVVGAAPVVHGEVMASSASNLAGVVVTGIEPETIKDVTELRSNIEVGSLDYLEHPEKLTRLPPDEVIGIGPGGEQYYKGAELPGLADDIDPDVRAVIIQKPDRPGVILGRELAKTLHVYVGDEITLVSPLGDLGPMGIMPRTKRFRVAAVFYSGMYEYDATYVYTMLGDAQEYFQTAGKISAIEIKVEDAERAERVTPLVVAAVGRPELRVRDWREINKNLFSALKLERFATFIILSIAIMVASFCIVCTLLLMVTEKGKEIAILKAVGATDGAILRIFMIEGVIIGGIGTVFGVVTGFAVCAGLSWFGLRLDPEVYYIDRLPITVNGWDFLTVAAAALTICTLSTIYPAYAASRLRPVDGLRYE
jgi:lipoprotein-releasing system permease protein